MTKKRFTYILMLSLWCFTFSSCNPYRAFKGVDTSEIRGGQSPSQKIHKGHKKHEKKATKNYKKEMKKRKKKMGSD